MLETAGGQYHRFCCTNKCARQSRDDPRKNPGQSTEKCLFMCVCLLMFSSPMLLCRSAWLFHIAIVWKDDVLTAQSGRRRGRRLRWALAWICERDLWCSQAPTGDHLLQSFFEGTRFCLRVQNSCVHVEKTCQRSVPIQDQDLTQLGLISGIMNRIKKKKKVQKVVRFDLILELPRA